MMVNTDRGAKMFEKVKDNIIWQGTKIEDSMQPPLKAPFPRPIQREQFWRDFSSRNFNYIVRKYTSYGKWNKVKQKIKGIVKKIYKGM